VIRAHFESKNTEEIWDLEDIFFVVWPVATARAWMRPRLIASRGAYRMLVVFLIGHDRASALKIHQEGLNEMITIRGGLEKLGIVGHLARTTAVTMLVGMENHSYM